MLLALTEFEQKVLVAVVSILGTLVANSVLNHFKRKGDAQDRHQFEKEYPINLDLHEKLINLRIALHDLVDDIGVFIENRREKAQTAANEFNAIVRDKGITLHESVLKPATRLRSVAFEIVRTYDRIQRIENLPPGPLQGETMEDVERRPDDLIRLEDENETSLAEVDRLFEVTKLAITKRVRP